MRTIATETDFAPSTPKNVTFAKTKPPSCLGAAAQRRSSGWHCPTAPAKRVRRRLKEQADEHRGANTRPKMPSRDRTVTSNALTTPTDYRQ